MDMQTPSARLVPHFCGCFLPIIFAFFQARDFPLLSCIQLNLALKRATVFDFKTQTTTAIPLLHVSR